MDNMKTFETHSISWDTVAFLSYYPLPFYGLVPINTFLIRSEQPVLIDTGAQIEKDSFLNHLGSVIDLQDLRWLWLTHADPDHVGSIREILDAAPNLRVVTTYLGMGKLDLLQIPIDRTYLLNPGQSLDVGDRQLLAVKPATYDAPETTGLFDTKSSIFFSADSFGALLKEPAEDAAAIPPSDLRDGLVLWATIDSPWLAIVDSDRFARSLDAIRTLNPEIVLSSHLPPAHGMTETLLGYLAEAQTAQPFQGLDQAELERLISETRRAA